MFHQMRELQARDMELKNQQIVELNLKQELESLQQARLDLEDQVSDQQSSICQYQL